MFEAWMEGARNHIASTLHSTRNHIASTLHSTRTIRKEACLLPSSSLIVKERQETNTELKARCTDIKFLEI
jgi:hypothetical protein